MKKYGNEFKVGVMIFLFLAGLLLLTVNAGNFYFKREGYTISVQFNNIMGLEKNAPVRLRGVEIGQVSEIALQEINDSTVIVLSLWIDEKYKIRGTPTILIRTLGLMGEKYIQIIDQNNSQQIVSSGATFQGKNPSDFEDVMDDAQKIANNANDLILEVKSVAEKVNASLDTNSHKIDHTIDHAWI